MKLKIEEYPETFGRYTKMWSFIDDNQSSNYSLRWAIAYRERDNWWGVVSMFPATHENTLDRIQKEMILAKQAIAILKTKYLANPKQG